MVFFGYPKYKQCKKEVDKIASHSTKTDFMVNEPTVVYDKDDNVLSKLSSNDYRYTKYQDLPVNCPNAFIAIEDRTFWNNPGYDMKGIVRVLVDFVKSHGASRHGASTITQQLCKNIYLTREVSIDRKIKEIGLAAKITKMYSKKEIMEFYVNNVNFGNNIYGIGSAAKYYFNKNCSDLTLSETAYLCAIPNRPEYYNPLKNPTNAIPRRDKILKDMYTCKFISKADMTAALNEPITLNHVNEQNNTNYMYNTFAVDCATKVLMKDSGFKFQYHFDTDSDYKTYYTNYDDVYESCKDKLYQCGYKVHTSLDPSILPVLQSTMDKHLAKTEMDGGMTIIDNKTDQVIAVVGGKTKDNDFFNRAYQGYRQPGSSMKPIVVYTPALDSGYFKNSRLKNISSEAAKKTKNLDALSGREISLQDAVEQSENGAAEWLLNQIGVDKGVSYLEKLHFSRIIPDDYTVQSALGGLSKGATTVEMAGAYHAIEDDGQFSEPTCILSIKDKNNKEHYYKNEKKEIYSKDAALKMQDVLKGVITNGTAKKLKWDNSLSEAFAKTGTTSDNKDGWFCGVTPQYTIAVYTGCDQPKSIKNLWGNTYPAYIWKDAMTALLDGKPAETFNNEDPGNISDMDPNAELSPGYTKQNYDDDKNKAAKIDDILTQKAMLDNNIALTKDERVQKSDSLYNEAVNICDSIYGMTLKGQYHTKIQSAF